MGVAMIDSQVEIYIEKLILGGIILHIQMQSFFTDIHLDRL